VSDVGTASPQVTDLEKIGLSWRRTGEAALSGPLLNLAQRLDQAFLLLATIAWNAQDERHPATLPVERLQRVHYLNSFPHHATFPARLDPDDANLDQFRSGPVVGPDGHVVLTRLAPVREILTPAACYHLYVHHEGERLAAPLYLTTCNTCFRNERNYEPLRRQWSFTMREIVCLGTASEATRFLEASRAALDLLLAEIGLDVTWAIATDPFFRPLENPGYLLQRVHPVKHEAVYGGGLAIGSANLHAGHFGEAFDISRDGRAAHSACIAFGIERWLFALTDRHGTDPGSWPDPLRAAERAARLAAADPDA
jgi:hypothetical protein